MNYKFFAVILLLVGMPAGLRAAEDALLGKWKLNLAKSKYDPGPAPTTPTINTYVKQSADGLTVITDGTDGEGRPDHTEYSAKYGGEDFPVKGERDFDSVAIQRIDRNTTFVTNKMHGKVVRLLRRKVSVDGKTLTNVMVGITTTGVAIHNVTIYDRQ